ncbi:MAG: sugar transferase [Planctomycetes bacterium]|nr:sugar transferase [Planctomycetota bacterium]
MSRTLWARGGKRLFDVVAATALLALLSPLLLAAALLVKLTSPGPVFFRQDRGGWNGATFRLFKFRTMRGSRTPDPRELVPLDHPEITRVGWLLRRFKIDELPQLFNVFRGDMSLVGPRPTLPDQVAAYDDFRRQRLLVRPGITGLAQVNGSAAISWDERILFDIAYVRRCSLATDLGIFVRTLLVIAFGERRATRPFRDSRYARFVSPPKDYGSDASVTNGD